ncbi:MAG TPA: DNA mismatch repair protein MutS, partial [Rhodoferax sp.]
MKALLMYRDRAFDPKQDLPCNAQALAQDLELDTLLHAMAGEDEFLLGVAHNALLFGQQTDIDTILYRQAILKDCLNHPEVVTKLYEVAVAAIESKRTGFWGGILSNYPGSILSGSIELLQRYTDFLRTLRTMAEAHAANFTSEGFTCLFVMLQQELGDDYLARIQAYLSELKFTQGVLVSAELGSGNAGVNYMLRKPNPEKRNWLERIFVKRPPAYTFQIADRDQAGANALTQLRDRGIHLAANVLAQSADHI